MRKIQTGGKGLKRKKGKKRMARKGSRDGRTSGKIRTVKEEKKGGGGSGGNREKKEKTRGGNTWIMVQTIPHRKLTEEKEKREAIEKLGGKITK